MTNKGKGVSERNNVMILILHLMGTTPWPGCQLCVWFFSKGHFLWLYWCDEQSHNVTKKLDPFHRPTESSITKSLLRNICRQENTFICTEKSLNSDFVDWWARKYEAWILNMHTVQDMGSCFCKLICSAGVLALPNCAVSGLRHWSLSLIWL